MAYKLAENGAGAAASTELLKSNPVVGDWPWAKLDGEHAIPHLLSQIKFKMPIGFFLLFLMTTYLLRTS